ncbi:MAG TPA: hypothetical protein VHP83_00085 [Aggregatilineaceae bacterium]|nr:hypothetical protein [Aggregatilineaceae bacterium]
MKCFVLLISLLALSLSPTLVIAQDDTSNIIEYGQTVTGEITNKEFEVEYRFTGSTGDVIIIEMKPVDSMGDLTMPAIVVLDTEYTVLWNAGAYGNVTLSAMLPYDGEYAIFATRDDGRAGDSVGEYTLTLSNAPVLEVGVPIEGNISGEDIAYYAINATAGSFTVNYEKMGGELFPEITLNVISEGQLEQTAVLSGTIMSGAIGIDPSYLTSDILLLAIRRGLWDWSSSENTVSYGVTLNQ